MKIAIIGAGASGLLAALNAAWQGASVTLFERNDSLGRKLLVTGSGRCNFTNDRVATEQYTCDDPVWLGTLLDQFPLSVLLNTFEALGIPAYKTWDGWYYPRSDSAHSVVNAIAHAVHSSAIDTRLSTQVVNIAQKDAGFEIIFYHNTNEYSKYFDRVIVSSGGKAYPSLGSKGELFPVLRRLDHTIQSIQPALAPILADLQTLTALRGVRLDVGVRLLQDETTLASSAGNMIFTEWGLNGPAVMDISHHIPQSPGDSVWLSLNLLHYIQTEFNHLIAQKRETNFPVFLLLSAFFPPKVSYYYTKLFGLSEATPLSALNPTSVLNLTRKLTDTRVKVLGVRGYQYCQASAGGVLVCEVNPVTLESRVQPGLFLTGETLNVVGPCGGYNLHFAFASGSLAGRAAGVSLAGTNRPTN